MARQITDKKPDVMKEPPILTPLEEIREQMGRSGKALAAEHRSKLKKYWPVKEEK
jgi:hypothetical protein